MGPKLKPDKLKLKLKPAKIKSGRQMSQWEPELISTTRARQTRTAPETEIVNTWDALIPAIRAASDGLSEIIQSARSLREAQQMAQRRLLEIQASLDAAGVGH